MSAASFAATRNSAGTTSGRPGSRHTSKLAGGWKSPNTPGTNGRGLEVFTTGAAMRSRLMKSSGSESDEAQSLPVKDDSKLSGGETQPGSGRRAPANHARLVGIAPV